MNNTFVTKNLKSAYNPIKLISSTSFVVYMEEMLCTELPSARRGSEVG